LKFKRFTSILAAAALSMLPACQLWAQGLPLQVEQNQLDRVGGARPNRVDPQANLRISERQAVGLARDRFAGNVLRIDFPEYEEINLPTHHAFKVVLKCDC
jgi:hypothetical protein